MIATDWTEIHDMHLGQMLEFSSCDVRRVPGGWIMAEVVMLPSKFKDGADYAHRLPPVFVPHSTEFAPHIAPKPDAPPRTRETPPDGGNEAKRATPGTDDDDDAPF